MENLDNVFITLITAFITAIFTSRISSSQYWRQKKADLEAEYSSRFNTKKWEVYTEFTALVPEINGNGLSDINTPIVTTSINSLAPQIVLAGSDNVVIALRRWRETNEVYGPGDTVTKDKLFELIVEMRKDLGNIHTQLANEDLLGALKPIC